MDIKKFIENIVTEASLDRRVPNGVVDLKNVEHVQVIAEAMYDSCGNEQVVNEFVNIFTEGGKYPDRQAFNKEGWLVTFPSAEYKKAAIKRGTHFPSDPTHGTGGMNLYYKKMGKQRRQTQQVTTATDTQTQPQSNQGAAQARGDDSKPSAPSTPQKSEEPASTKTPVSVGADKPSMKPSTGTSADSKQEPAPSSDADTKSDLDAKDTPVSKQTSQDPVEEPIVPSEPMVDYVQMSTQFANSKGWKTTPYGEWHDMSGNPAAVVGLTGEIVPIKSIDRDEYQLFVEKNKV